MKKEMIKTAIICFLLGAVIFAGSASDTEDEKQPVIVPTLLLIETTS